MKNRISHFRKSRPHMMMVTFHLRNVRLIFSSEEFPASEEVFASTAELGSVNCSILALLWSYVIASTFCSFMHGIPSFPYFSGWRLCVYLQPPLKNMLRRPWGGTSFVQIFENFENLTISSFWWKEINLRLTVSKDFNGLLLVEEFFSHRKALSGLVNPLGLRTDL